MCCNAQQMDKKDFTLSRKDRNQAIGKIMLVMSQQGRPKTWLGLDVTLTIFSYSHRCTKTYEIHSLRKYPNMEI